MTLTDKGYFASSENVIANIIANYLEKLIGRSIDRTGGSFLWMLIRAFADRILSQQQTQEDLSHMQSAIESIGVFLEMFAEEAGVERGGAEKATGYVRASGLAVGSPLGDVPEGTIFNTPTGVNYETTENATFLQRIPVVHQDDNIDSVPTPYSNVTASKVVSVSKYSDGSGEYSPSNWSVSATDEITWTGSYPDTPLTNAVYYVNINPTEEIDVDISVVASVAGSSQNVTEDSITINTNSIASVSSVTNPEKIDNGLDEESEDSFRNRIIGTPYGDWSVARMKKEALQVVGVRTAQIVESEGVDQYDPEDWLTVNDSNYKTIDNGHEYAQLFRSGERVLSLSSVTIRVKASEALATTPLFVAIYVWKGDYNTTVASTPSASFTFYPTDLDQDLLAEFQDVDIPLKIAGLDPTLRFLIRTWVDPSAVNSWRIVYNTSAIQTQGLFEKTGSITVWYDQSLVFKTKFKGRSYTCYISPKPGYTFDDIGPVVDSTLDAYTPVCTEKFVVLADLVPINVKAFLVLSDGYSLSDVSDDIESGVSDYVNGLSAGEKVILVQIGRIIAGVQGVLNYKDLYLTRSTSEPFTWIQGDVSIGKNEVAVPGDPGVSFTE